MPPVAAFHVIILFLKRLWSLRQILRDYRARFGFAGVCWLMAVASWESLGLALIVNDIEQGMFRDDLNKSIEQVVFVLLFVGIMLVVSTLLLTPVGWWSQGVAWVNRLLFRVVAWMELPRLLQRALGACLGMVVGANMLALPVYACTGFDVSGWVQRLLVLVAAIAGAVANGMIGWRMMSERMQIEEMRVNWRAIDNSR